MGMEILLLLVYGLVLTMLIMLLIYEVNKYKVPYEREIAIIAGVMGLGAGLIFEISRYIRGIPIQLLGLLPYPVVIFIGIIIATIGIPYSYFLLKKETPNATKAGIISGIAGFFCGAMFYFINYQLLS